MAIGVLIIGDEILSGRRQDKHLAKAIELLGVRGMRLAWARYCGDDRPRLVATLRDCFASDDIFFSFGGIGATPDDHTRQAAAEALGQALILNVDAEREIRGRFGEETTPLRLEMGRFPAQARAVPNPYNRVPGFAVASGYFFPGFPVMAWPMMEWALDGELAGLRLVEPYVEVSLWVFDAQESQITPLMCEVQECFGVTVFSLPNTHASGRRRQIELGAKGSPEAVERAMDALRSGLAQLGFPVGMTPLY